MPSGLCQGLLSVPSSPSNCVAFRIELAEQAIERAVFEHQNDDVLDRVHSSSQGNSSGPSGNGQAAPPARGATDAGGSYRLNSASAPLRCFCLAAISARARAISASSAAIYSSQLGDPEQGQILRLLRLVARNQILFVDDCHVRPLVLLPSAGPSHYIDSKALLALFISGHFRWPLR